MRTPFTDTVSSWLVGKDARDNACALRKETEAHARFASLSNVREGEAMVRELADVPRYASGGIAGIRVELPHDNALKDVDMFVSSSSGSAPFGTSGTSGTFGTFGTFETFGTSEGAATKKAAHDTLFDALNRCATLGSSLFLREVLSNPICDARTLRARTAVLDRLQRVYESVPPISCRSSSSSPSSALSHTQRTQLTQRTQRHLKRERDALWALSTKDASTSALHDMAYFQCWFLKCLNGSPTCLTLVNWYRIAVSPLLGLLSPLVYFVFPYIILRVKARQLGIPAQNMPSFVAYLRMMYRSFVDSANGAFSSLPSGVGWVKYVSCGLSLLFYFQSLFNSAEISRTLSSVCRCLNQRASSVVRFAREAAELVERAWDDDVRTAFFPDVCGWSATDLKKLLMWTASNNDHEDTVVSDLERADDDNPTDQNMFGAHVGQGLVALRRLRPQELKSLMRCYYALDALLSVCRVRECGYFSIPRFMDITIDEGCSEARSPTLVMEGVWHPCLNRREEGDGVIENDVRLVRDNMILTGPNAGGKSTLMKACIASVVLAQSIITAPCSRSMSLTPFSFVNTHVNVPDAKGVRSLFEEEMHRAKLNFDALRSLPEGRVALVVMDEVFSSTNPVEGVAGAFAVAKALGEATNCVSLISTHYTYLCKLGASTASIRFPSRKRFQNWQMPVIDTFDGQSPSSVAGTEEHLRSLGTVPSTSVPRFSYAYKLVPGVCRQHVALELLRENGFDDFIIEEAIRVKNHLTDTNLKPRT